MAKRSRFDQLDLAVQVVVAGRRARPPADAKLAALVRVAAELRELPGENFKARLKADLERSGAMGTKAVAAPESLQTEQGEARKPAVAWIREGFRTVTPYLVAREAEGLIEFIKQAFGAEGQIYGIGSAGGLHSEYRIGDSMIMLGGGVPGRVFRGKPMPTALHLYVKDADAVYRRAIEAGAMSIAEPADMFYGDREGGVKDLAGNHWYIATHKATGHAPEGFPSVQVYLHPLRAEPVISFLKRAFGAEELGRHASPDGVIHHATVKIGSSFLEMGEAHGEFQPMPTMFYLYVEDADAWYRRAMAAGATSISEPADQPYGGRVGGVTDPFGNMWYLGTHIKDATA